MFIGKGDGTFAATVVPYPNGWDFGNPSKWQTIVGDFNGDGLTDYARVGAKYAHIFLSKGDGTFDASIYNYPDPGWDFGLSDAWPVISWRLQW